jgi:hypothetical protein
MTERRKQMAILVNIAKTGALFTGLMIAVTAARAACSCGPDFCQDDPRVPATLAGKEASLRASGYPDRLISLIDRGDQCVARITRSPDIFTMWVIDSKDAKQTVPWSADNERNAMNKVRSGELKRFWIYNARRAFSCCNQPNYDQRPDYDRGDDVSAATAIKCTATTPC